MRCTERKHEMAGKTIEVVWRCSGCGHTCSAANPHLLVQLGGEGYCSVCCAVKVFKEYELHPPGTGAELERLWQAELVLESYQRAIDRAHDRIRLMGRTIKRLRAEIDRLGCAKLAAEGLAEEHIEMAAELERLRAIVARMKEALTQIIKRDDWTAGEVRHCARVALGEEP